MEIGHQRVYVKTGEKDCVTNCEMNDKMNDVLCVIGLACVGCFLGDATVMHCDKRHNGNSTPTTETPGSIKFAVYLG